jgi:predicted Abi (CAAX) family protease
MGRTGRIEMNKFALVVTLAALLLATSLVFATGGASAETVSGQVTQVVINNETYTVTTSDSVDTTSVAGCTVEQYVVDGFQVYLCLPEGIQVENQVQTTYTTTDGTSTVTVNSCNNCIQSVNNVLYLES